MAKTPDVVAKEIIEKLQLTAPGFSLEPGTPERKIVDACAEAISEAYIEQYLVGSLLDIESKAAIELEQFVGIFGFGRNQGEAATGTVRIELNTANAQDINVPLGSQFYTRQSLPGTGTPLYFSSTQAVTIPAGTYVVDVPVKCTTNGTVGNVPPDTVVYVGDIIGATSVTNLQAFTGGKNTETDAELRQRFKDTFLRSVVGTEDWYLNLAYQNKHISKAACFGPVSKYATQVVVQSGEMDMSNYISADVKYAWDSDWHVLVFKNLGQSDEKFYRRGVDYTWTAGIAPKFTRIPTGSMQIGDVVDIEFEYTTRSSRNDPTRGIANKVDVFINGSDPYTVTERTKVLGTDVLSDSINNRLYVGNFARVGTPGTPAANNRFTRLGSNPIISFPSIITVKTKDSNGANVINNYQQGRDYHLLRSAPDVTLNDTTLLAGSPYELTGIEWTATGPADDTPVTLTYVYNRVPELLQAVMKSSKQVATDVMVHQAGYRYLRVHLSVEHDRGFVPQQVNNAIQERLRTYFAGMPYGAWIEFSDLTLAVHQVLGVDNVRVTSPDPDIDPGAGANHGIMLFGDSSDVVPLATINEDFKMRDNQLPVFLEAIIRRRPNR